MVVDERVGQVMMSADTRAARQAALDALLAFKRSFREQVAYPRAIAGNGAGTLDVPNAIRRVYAEKGGSGGAVVEAQWDQFKPTLGLPIYLTRANIMGAGGWLVLGQAGGDDLPCVPVSELA